MDDRGTLGSSKQIGPLDEASLKAAAKRPLRVDRRRSDELRSALHDRLGPGLANLEMRLEMLEATSGRAGLAPDQVAHLKHEVAGLVRELFRIVHDEPPELLEREGLVRALRAACLQAERPGLRIDFTVAGAPLEPPAAFAELLYRAALEGTTNVARHAAASRCLVRLSFTPFYVTLEVRDNGKGALTQHVGRAAAPTGLGLASLGRAARRLGGEAHLLHLPAGGSKLVVRLPLRERFRVRPGAPPDSQPRT